MASTISVISYIKSVSTSSDRTTGIAVYRYSKTNYHEFEFKFFINNNNSLIIPVEKFSMYILTGKFTYKNRRLLVI
jgi:hypothetical protein